ncbi:tyrosine-type recombinase/integrase [Sphingobium yanoikuyae]|jgi:integrase|uniref:Integrase n=1 Tax=Sphingobium yanoikuyae TaxID=13690 RepID=A0A291N591_SPHYA|nr:site-specific integrase [Sphingobium yanoikuyae]ATI82513.1 integrase [Sphingobium yanoikuyae]
MAKITKTLIEAQKPSKDGVKGSNHLLWDSELRGFGVSIGQSRRSFVVQYRLPNGQSRRKVIGRFGLMTVEEARRQARIILGDVANGRDPVEDARSSGQGYTVDQICDWYLERASAGKIIGRSRKPIKASTLTMDRSRVDAHIRPLLGHRIIATLKLGDIEGAQADIAAGATSKPRVGSRGGATKGGEGVASRCMSTLHSIFEHAVRLGEIEKNPARGIRRIASTPKMRWLSQAEIRKLGIALREAEADDEHPTGIAVIRLLLLTGFRRLEALSLERDWLLDEESAIHFRTTKTGAQRRVIGQPALRLLSAQADSGSRYFFPADWGEGHFIGIVRVLDRICHRAGLEGVTPHVLRHTFASVAGGLGYSELTIAALLGHASRGVTQRYIHIDEPLRAAATAVAEYIDELLRGCR